MLQRLREAGLIWPTVATIVALGVLVSLGTWQVQRKQWKDGLVARIAARIKRRRRLSARPGARRRS